MVRFTLKPRQFVRTYYALTHIFAPLSNRVERLLMAPRYYIAIALMITGFVHTSAQDTLNIDMMCMDGAPGDTVCISVTIDNFDNIGALQIPIIFDPTVLSFLYTENDALGDAVQFSPGPTVVNYVWFDVNGLGVSLPDGTLLFDICFEVIGLPGSMSPVLITSNHTLDLEIGDIDGNIVETDVEDCTVNVLDPNAVGAYVTACGSPNGVDPGSFTVTIFGGTEPYDYSWTGPDNGMSTIATSGDSETQVVQIGSYVIDVTDGAGGTFQVTVDVLPLGFLGGATGNDPTCYNFTNGQLSIEAAQGAPPYSVVWRSLEQSQIFGSGYINVSGGVHFVNSLPNGNYEVEIVDDLGCSFIDTVRLAVDSFDITANVTNATCFGAGNGEIDIQVSGGTPLPGGYMMTFSWGGSIVTDDFSSGPLLDPGTYFITISDAQAQCDTVFEFEVLATVNIEADIVVTDPTCAGAADGSVVITGIPAGLYDFQRYDEMGNPDGMAIMGVASATFLNISAGTYGVVLDDGSCQSDTLPFVLTDPAPITIDVVNITNTSCVIGSTDGSITVQASGGTVAGGSDYTYLWNGGTLSGSMINNLGAGNYDLTVTDDNMCTAELNLQITQSDGPQIVEIIATNLSCTGEPVTTLEVIYNEGSSPVDLINWTDTQGNSIGNTAIITNQTGGDTLDLLIADEDMCFDVLSNYIVPGGNDMNIDSIRLVNPTCPGDDDGQFTVFVSGGTMPYTYIWSTGDTNTFNLLPGLVAGTYSVTVVDADSCGIVDTTITLEDIEPFDFFFTGIDSTGCSTTCSGEATLIPGGGDPGLPFNFFWASGQMETGVQSTATGLCAGWQTVTISQDNFCFFTDSVFIPAPDSVAIEVVDLQNVSCNGTDDGLISLSASGGAGSGYMYDWATLPSGPTQNGLSPGTYYVTVTDADMCMASDSFVIIQPDSIEIVLDSTTLRQISCTGDSDGQIGVQVIGGSPGFDFQWLPDVGTGPIAQLLGPGTYEVTVTDQAGCTDSLSVTLDEPAPIEVFMEDATPPTCVGGSTEISIDSVAGGNGPYTYSINGGQDFPIDSTISLPVGFFNVIVEDANGCADTTPVSIIAPEAIELEIIPPDPVVLLGDSVMLELIVSNTQGPVDSLAWGHDEPGSLSCYDCFTPWAMNVTPATYFVQVWDSAGCLAETQVLVNVDNRRNIYLPNVFSPNRDGRNEEFRIFTGQGVERIQSVRVFNRWGELMTEVRDQLPDPDGVYVWDGEFKGRQMQPGVYVYMAEVIFIDRPNDPVIVTGDLTLLR